MNSGKNIEWESRPDLSPEDGQNFWNNLSLEGRRTLLKEANSQLGTTLEDLAQYESKWENMPNGSRTLEVQRYIMTFGSYPERYQF